MQTYSREWRKPELKDVLKKLGNKRELWRCLWEWKYIIYQKGQQSFDILWQEHPGGRQTVILQNETDILSQYRLMTWKSCPYSAREFGVYWSLECAHKCTHLCACVRASLVNRLGFTMLAKDGYVVECMWRNRVICWRMSVGSVIWWPCWVASMFPTSPISQTVETSGWFDWNKDVVLKGGRWIVSHFWKHSVYE